MTEPRSNGEHSTVADRRWRAVTLQNRGLTLRQIAETMKDDYNPALTLEQCAAQVGVDVSRALKDARARMDKSIEEKITQQEIRFADIRRQIYGVLARPHYVLHQGQIVRDGEGNPLRDSAPVLAALAQLRGLEDQEAKLHGTYSSEKITLALDRRTELESSVVAEAILAGFDAAGLEPQERMLALEAAQQHLRTIDGEVVSEETTGE